MGIYLYGKGNLEWLSDLSKINGHLSDVAEVRFQVCCYLYHSYLPSAVRASFFSFFFGHYLLGQPYSFPKHKFSVDIKIGKWAEYRVKLDLFHLF